MEYNTSLNRSSSEHLGFPGCHLQSNTKMAKHMFKHVCGSPEAFQINHYLNLSNCLTLSLGSQKNIFPLLFFMIFHTDTEDKKKKRKSRN